MSSSTSILVLPNSSDKAFDSVRRSDQYWIKKLRPSADKASNLSDDGRWGYLKPFIGATSVCTSTVATLDLNKGCDDYMLEIDQETRQLFLLPGDDETRYRFKLREAEGTWTFIFHDIKHESALELAPLVDGQTVYLYAYQFIFYDTINSKEGAFTTYDLVSNDVVGKGSYGRVQKVVERANPRIVYAVKIIHPQTDSTFPTYEISTLEALRNDFGICFLREVFVTTDDVLHLILEYVEKGSLQILLDSGFLVSSHSCSAEELAGCIAFQICKATKYIHSKGIIHRDLKPGNILVSSTLPLLLKVADFGFATWESLEPTEMWGTDEYMAPELTAEWNCGLAYNNSVDAYSVGAILFDMLLVVLGHEPDDIRDIILEDFPVSYEGISLPTRLDRMRQKMLLDWETKGDVNDQALSLAKGLLQHRASKRISMADALENSWMNKMNDRVISIQMPPVPLTPTRAIDEDVSDLLTPWTPPPSGSMALPRYSSQIVSPPTPQFIYSSPPASTTTLDAADKPNLKRKVQNSSTIARSTLQGKPERKRNKPL